MLRFVRFELEKIWKKPSFLLSVVILLCINLFLLWYTNIPNEYEADLSAYKQFQMDISQMTEKEKGEYVTALKETIDGISVVQRVLLMQQISGEMGETLAEQEMQKFPGVFEQYYDTFIEESYLRYTDTYEKEKAFIDEIYKEYSKVSGYEEYLISVQENKNILSGISIFSKQGKESFSSQNVEKSAADYAKLSADSIHWFPSKGVVLSMENQWLDVLLLLSVFLFVGTLIMEEKEKQLFCITRCTKNGIDVNICAKVSALLVHCSVLAFLFYGVNILFAWITTGAWNWCVPLQSLAPYMESNLQFRVLEYIVCSIVTKIMVLFALGALLCCLCLIFKQIYLPYLIGFSLWGIGWLLYNLIPEGTAWNIWKYMNFAGLFRTEDLYGNYLNFDFLGYPMSRLGLSWGMIGIFIVLGIVGCVLFFVFQKEFEIKNSTYLISKKFVPHNSLLCYEGYKILITNHGAVVLVIFALLIGYNDLQKEYHPSVYEQYYQNMMTQLEGTLTEEKAVLIQSEQARFQEAFVQIAQIEEKEASGEIDKDMADAIKSKWYAVTAFYPSFQRVEDQYNEIRKDGGDFVYDTGYLYFFGQLGDGMLVDLLLLSLAIILAFSNVIASEYETEAWKLIATTSCGKQKVIIHKMLICLGLAILMAFVPIVCRYIHISMTYPMRSLNVLGWLLLFVFFQALAIVLVALVVLFISNERKNHLQTIFFSILVLIVPLVLSMLEFTYAEWFSVYPLYS